MADTDYHQMIEEFAHDIGARHLTVEGAYCHNCQRHTTSSHHGLTYEPVTCNECGFNIRCWDCGSSACFVDYYLHDPRIRVTTPITPGGVDS